MKTEVDCVVKNARPAPTFTWHIDGKKVQINAACTVCYVY
jgi:hypothetical protein